MCGEAATPYLADIRLLCTADSTLYGAPDGSRDPAIRRLLSVESRQIALSPHVSDTLSNAPRQVYATDAEDGVPPSFELTEASDYWEVPIEGHGPPENPVPGEGLNPARAVRPGAPLQALLVTVGKCAAAGLCSCSVKHVGDASLSELTGVLAEGACSA